ncbi:putative inorganic phosphate cotransporter isoform X2 [Leguminivora glycinivorella]|uniref:putative inorganic phosphate cotransporter isoform X2 n=1 Tax=Leguminivora glycinivorella TaxID=1035111 RepID=UPI00200EAE56|nr:putative inorganic phosphate cotransporter isoform X2 [Leguminivora glycinivorella]
MKESERESQYQKVPTRELIKENIPEIPVSYGYGFRHVQVALLLLSLTVAYAARAHIGLTVVAMSKPPRNTSISNSSGPISASIYNNTVEYNNETLRSDINGTVSKIGKDDSIWNVYMTYEWPKSIQELILDSFFLGYFLMMFPTGMIAQRFGGKIPLQVCMLVNGVISIVTPFVAAWGGWKAVCCCRVIQGLSQAGVYPSIQTVLSKWAPASERGRFASYIYSGSTIGTVIAFQSSGALSSSKAGWPATFWLFGAVCIAAFILLTFFAAGSPTEHKKISEEEKTFILGRIDDGVKTRMATPWKQILLSKHVWGAFAVHVASGVCFVFFITQTPTYMFYILGFNIKNSGILSSLPYIASIILSVVYGIVSDYCTNRGIVSLKTARIACNSLAQIGPALCLVAVSFTENSALAVVLLVLGVGLLAGVHVGWMLNYIDLSPNFSGSLMALGNTLTSFTSLSQPILISNIVTDVRNRFQWRIMMFLMATIIFITNGIYASLISTDVQPWDQIESKESSDTEKKKSNNS